VNKSIGATAVILALIVASAASGSLSKNSAWVCRCHVANIGVDSRFNTVFMSAPGGGEMASACAPAVARGLLPLKDAQARAQRLLRGAAPERRTTRICQRTDGGR